MDREFWIEVTSRLSNKQICDLDDILSISGVTGKAGATTASFSPVHSFISPSRLMWASEGGDQVPMGVRVSKPISDPLGLAGNLAALAGERSIIPIILSKIGPCGLERFGFRVEDIACEDEKISKELEQQITQFWSIDIVIDAEELQHFS